MTQKKTMGDSNGRLRIAVVGLGRMGQLHLHTFQRLSCVSVSALIDLDHHKSHLASLHDIPFFATCETMAGKVDAAIIATPAHQHVACALPLLEAGIHCLVEKPLAPSVSELEQLGAAASRREVVLAVGHSERFNPGVVSARTALHQFTRSIHVIRKQLVSARHVTDIDVVQDLMVHDLDWIVHVVGELPVDLQIIDSHQLDGRLEAASCKLVFSNGLEVVLEVNRVAAARHRVIVLHNGSVPLTISLDQPRDAQPDALTKQAEAFIGAVRGERVPVATWTEARDVMALVRRIQKGCALTIDSSADTILVI